MSDSPKQALYRRQAAEAAAEVASWPRSIRRNVIHMPTRTWAFRGQPSAEQQEAE